MNQPSDYTIDDVLFSIGPWKSSKSHVYTLPLHPGPGENPNPHTYALSPLGGLAGGDGRPALANKQRGTPKEFT
jgi:hypothetical protein